MMKQNQRDRTFRCITRRLRLAHRWLLSALVLFVATGSASANYYELLRRVPDSANTLILIDVERMLMSPIAMKEKWRDKANTSERETLHFPINSVRYMLASKLNFVSNFEDIWDVALIETINDVSLPYLAKMEGGYLDTVEGQQVALLAPQRLLRLVKAHDPGRLLPGQPAGPRTLAAVAPASQGAAGLGVSPECGHAGAWQGSHRRRV